MRVGLVLLALSAPPALAQDAPSFDCARAAGGAEELVCADPALADLDRRLADHYAAALAAAQSLDAGAAEAEANLRAGQRGWIGGRDECWKAENPATCVRDAYLRREAELVTRWMLEIPVNTVVWTCGGSPANEVVTVFFDTELPSLRFERGDDIDTGTITRTASGARYEGSFGRYIWTKGSEATYRDPDPGGAEYRCVIARDP